MLVRTAGEIRGKSLCGPRVFSRVLRKSWKSRGKSVHLFWFRWLFSLFLRGTDHQPGHPLPTPHSAFMPIYFRRSPNVGHFVRATKRAMLPILTEEIDDSVVVVDADLQDVWLELIPGQGSLPEDAPAINQSIVYVVEEKGTNIEGQTTVIVWWLERAASLLPESADLWTPMRAPGPTSGEDQSQVIFIIYDLLYSTLTTFARSVIILIFEVVLVDCPKSWSGLLALAAARVLGIRDAEAFINFLCTAEMMFTEQDGIIWAAEPQLGFFIHFINAALDAKMPVVVAAVHEHASHMQMSKTAAVEYLAGQFQVEARWLAAAGAPIYEPLRWIIRKTPRPQAAFAWTQIREILCDHELPWPVDLLLARARLVITQGGTSFWWRGQGGGDATAAEQDRMRTLWSSRAQAKVSCQNAPGPANCHGTWGNWGGMCTNCRRDPTAYARDPCVAKFEHGAGRRGCYGPNDTRGSQCVTCAGKLDKRKLAEGSARAANVGSNVRSAVQLEACPGCGRQVKVCRAARRDNRVPRGKTEVCQAC